MIDALLSKQQNLSYYFILDYSGIDLFIIEENKFFVSLFSLKLLSFELESQDLRSNYLLDVDMRSQNVNKQNLLRIANQILKLKTNS